MFGLTLRSLIHFEFFLCMVLGSVLISFFALAFLSLLSTQRHAEHKAKVQLIDVNWDICDTTESL